MFTISRRLFLSASFCCLASGVAKADLYDDYVNSASKQPFVKFLARNSPGSSGLPGHSFVGFGVEVDNGELIYERLAGFYPADDGTLNEIKAIFTSVSGSLMETWKDLSWDIEFRKDVDQDGHDKALAVAKEWYSNDPKYNLLANGGKNCSSFAAAVAKAIGLQAPDGECTTLPINYMTKLKTMNGG